MKLLFCLVFSLSVSQANASSAASLTIEPYLGFSKLSQKEVATENVDDAANGVVLGARGGLRFGDLYGALDYHLGGSYAMDLAGRSYINTLFGAGGGYFGNKYRIWIGYYGLDRLEDMNQLLEYRGKAYKAVLGFVARSKIIFNVEYIYHDFTIKKSFGSDLPFTSLSASVMMLSVSSPLDFK